MENVQAEQKQRIDLIEAFQVPEEYNPPQIYVDLQKSVDYPNYNAFEYRQQPVEYKMEMLPFLEFIAKSDGGTFVIGCNEYVRRLQYGNIFGFESPEILENAISEGDITRAAFRLQAYTPINAVEFVEENVLLLGEFSGGLHLYSLRSDMRPTNTEGYCLFLVGSKREHRGALRSCEVFKSKRQKVVTGDSLGTLKLWDISSSDLTSIHTLRYAHSDSILGIATSKENDETFATCSSDKSVSLWDMRETRPAIYLLKEHSQVLKCIQWLDENRVLIGDRTGKILVVDQKMPNKILVEEVVHDRSLHRIIPNG